MIHNKCVYAEKESKEANNGHQVAKAETEYAQRQAREVAKKNDRSLAVVFTINLLLAHKLDISQKMRILYLSIRRN